MRDNPGGGELDPAESVRCRKQQLSVVMTNLNPKNIIVHNAVA